VLEDDAIPVALGDRPGEPADEAVDRVARLGLAERQVMPRASELVSAVLDPVRPRDEHLAAPGAGHLVGAVAVDDVAAAHGVGTEAGADLDDDGPLVSRGNLDLLTGRQAISHQAASRSSRWSPTRSEFAIAVSAGLTAPMLGKTLVSTT
jgi:hypothetical protein